MGYEKFSSILKQMAWSDGSFDSLLIDYDSVTVTLRDSLDDTYILVCSGYIGLKSIGYWDESVLSKIELHKEHEMIDECITGAKGLRDEEGNLVLDTGCPQRNIGEWFLLKIVLIDGHEMFIVAADFDIQKKETDS